MIKAIRKSFVIKAATAAAALAFAVAMGGAVISYSVTRSHLEQTIQNEMDTRAKLISAHLGNELQNIVDALSQMAQNTLFANALADSGGRANYLRPFLISLRQVGGIPVRVELSDFRGQPLESNLVRSFSDVNTSMLKRTVESGNPQIHLDVLGSRNVVVTISWPVLYANTGLPEGALTYQFDFKSLTERGFFQKYKESFRIVFEKPGAKESFSFIEGEAPPAQARFLAMPLSAPEVFSIWSPAVEVWEDEKRETEGLKRLALNYMILAGLGLAIILPVSLFGARRILARLKSLESVALKVVETKSLDLTFPEEGRDEIANLGQAFNHMLDDLKRAYQALRDESLREMKLQSERFDRVLSATAEGYIRIDINTRKIEEVNEAFCRMTEQSAEKWNGQPAPEFLVALLTRAQYVQQPMAWTEEGEMQSPKGRNTAFLINALLDLDEDGNKQLVAFLTDISERKKAEQLILHTVRFKAVVDLASGVAHNFNNLLQIVIGNANLALMHLQSGDFSDMKENLEQIVESAQFGAQTVRRLNRFAKTHAEERTLDATETFDFSNLVRQAIEMARPWWKTNPEKKGIRIDLELSLTDRCLVKGRQNEMFEVIVNLIKNATEALPQGGAIRIETSQQSDQITLRVQDTGIGIRKEDVDRLFTPFFTTSVEAGRGLGLATTGKIVEEHGGRISVESKEGEGTAFTVILPLARALPDADQGPPTPGTCEPLTILAIDDMEATLRLLREGLQAFNHHVLTALSGKEALEILKDTRVDLVICDLGMPGMNGWQVGAAIKDVSAKRDLPKPRFIILTGWGDQFTEEQKMLESGVDAVIEKPADVLKLLNVIEHLVGNK